MSIIVGGDERLTDEGDETFKLEGRGLTNLDLIDARGRRKYLNAAERRAFIAAARKREHEVFMLCWLLHDTGCRLSEALALTPERIDHAGQMIIFESLKKRRRGIYRAVPCSPKLIKALRAMTSDNAMPIWPWHRMTAYRRIKEIMTEIGVRGPHATSRGLRHGFGVAAVESGVPLNLIQRWLGHARMETTAIYADAVGEEEIKIASRLWTRFTE